MIPEEDILCLWNEHLIYAEAIGEDFDPVKFARAIERLTGVMVGDFYIQQLGDKVWIGRPDGEGGEFDLHPLISKFYKENF